MFVEGKSRTVFFPSNTLIYGISRDGSKNFNIRTCEHMILGQLRMGARQAKNAPLPAPLDGKSLFFWTTSQIIRTISLMMKILIRVMMMILVLVIRGAFFA